MANQTNDRRVRYTKHILRESLLELMKTKNIDKITVTDICKQADINRGTFYAHYRDPYDLLHHIEDELYREIEQALDFADREGGSSRNYTVILEIFRRIAAHSALCEILLGKHGDMTFLRKIIDDTQERFNGVWLKQTGNHDDHLYAYMYTFIANGSVGLIQRWIAGGMRESPEEVAAIVNTMAHGGLHAYINRQNVGKKSGGEPS